MMGICLDDGKIFKKVAKGACNFQNTVYSMRVVKKIVLHPTTQQRRLPNEDVRFDSDEWTQELLW